MERLTCCILCLFFFLPSVPAFAGEGEKDEEEKDILLKDCNVRELKADEKLCRRNKKQKAAKRLRNLEGKTELSKKRIDRLKDEKSEFSSQLSQLEKKLKKKKAGMEKEKLKQKLKQQRKADQKLSKDIKQIRRERAKYKAEIDKALKKLKSADQEQRKSLSKVVDTIEGIDGKVSDLTSTVKHLHTTATEAKAKFEELKGRIEQLENRVRDLEQGQVRVSTGAEMFLFWGGPGFTGFFSMTKLRKPFADSRFSLKGEVSLGAGFTRGALRPALKAELGPSFRISERVRTSLDVGYSQAHYFREDVAEFRYLYFAPGLNFQVADHFNAFFGGNLGTVFHRKGEKPDFGGGLQFGVSFEF